MAEQRSKLAHRVRKLIEARMMLDSNYIITDRKHFEKARSLASPGDTISVHPDDKYDPPTLYEVQDDGSVKELVP